MWPIFTGKGNLTNYICMTLQLPHIAQSAGSCAVQFDGVIAERCCDSPGVYIGNNVKHVALIS